MRRKPSGRGTSLFVVGSVVVAAAVLIAALPDSSRPEASKLTDPATKVEDFATALLPDAPYRPPTPAERRALVRTVDRLSVPAWQPAAPPGFASAVGVDQHTGRSFAMVSSTPNDERGWGLYLADRTAAPRLAVQVPHPRADLHTERVGTALFQRVPGAVLMVAGTHRRVANGAGDVAHQTDSMFHAVAEEQSRRGVPQIQLHGFEDTSLPDADVILSAGAGDAGEAHEEVAGRLADAGLRVCAAWRDRCGQLEGRTNSQGITAAEHGTPFVHVEMSRTVRDDPDKWRPLVDAFAEVEFPG